MKTRVSVWVGVSVAMFASVAGAHVSITSGSAVANTTQVVTFGVGHGCSGADTYRVEIEIPSTVTSIRPLASDFGRATVQTNAAGVVTSVTWQKADADALPADTGYYQLLLRLRPPNAPFTTVYFRAHQTCRSATGALSTVDWVGLPTDTVPDGGTAPEPAAALNLVPARLPGWNQYTVAQDVPTLATYFSDALIVWRGTAAYSVNPNTRTLISSTPGVTALTSLRASDSIWVRY
jgi:periplasmic copper chaperone A